MVSAPIGAYFLTLHTIFRGTSPSPSPLPHLTHFAIKQCALGSVRLTMRAGDRKLDVGGRHGGDCGECGADCVCDCGHE